MDVKVPFLHQHFLLFDSYYYEKLEASCDICLRKIYGLAYNCESCNFWLHDSCAQEQLPRQISHPAHSQHLLTLSTSISIVAFVCDICLTLCQGHVYICKDCNFKVDLLCASNPDGETLKKECQRSNHDRYEDFKHFSHEHSLTLFNYRKVAKYKYSCIWCGKFLSGMCYGCFLCYPNGLLHQSCLLKIPFRIFQHPFHPSHPLHIQRPKYSSNWCNACNDTFQMDEDAYICQKFDFSLHVKCARLQPTLKRDVHEHTLTYIPKTKSSSKDTRSQCNMCHEAIYSSHYEQNKFFWYYGNNVYENGNFYRCVLCNINFHLKCVPIPPTTIHEYHRHDLTFIDSFIEDDLGEYYCDICEEERNSKYPIYYCKECSYISHIHCALNKVDSKALMIPKTTWQEETNKKTDVGSQTDHLELEIEVFFHQHPVCFFEVNEDEFIRCKVCGLKISSKGYACESCDFYHLHETCTKLPFEIRHPLHPQHTLNLLANIYDIFICHECRYLNDTGFSYVCYQCNFKLDVKCATNFTTSTDEDRRLKQISKHCPFNQAHKLELIVYDYGCCRLCLLPQRGPIFQCTLCGYEIHESCLELIPWKIQVPVYPAHPLCREVINQYAFNSCCQVCGPQPSFASFILYSCKKCPNLRLHLPCANSLKRAIIIKGSDQSHEHYLFYYGAKWQEAFSMNVLVGVGPENDFSTCDKCGESLGSMAFYHCLFYRINLHLKCVPIPHLIQSKCHIHSFVLKDQHIEDDFGEYYCDICEEERHPEDHVYFCKQCTFVAHLECALKQAEKTTLAAKTYSDLEIDVEKLPYPELPYPKLF